MNVTQEIFFLMIWLIGAIITFVRQEKRNKKEWEEFIKQFYDQ